MAEFRLITTQKEIERPIIWNTDEVKNYVADVTSNFATLVYTDEQEAEAAKDRANLNKLREALKKAKKNVKEQNEIPYNVFAREVDEAIKMLDETIAHIDAQTEAMDQKRRRDNLDKAYVLYQMTIEAAGLGDWLPWEDILGMKANSRSTYEDIFGNKGSWGKSDDLMTAGKKVVDIFNSFIKNVTDSINTIKAMNSQFEAQALEVLKTTRSTEAAMKEMARLQAIEAEKQRAIEEAKRQAELEAQRKIEEERRRAELERQRVIEEEQRKAREEAERIRREEEAKRLEELERVRKEAEEKARSEKEKAEAEAYSRLREMNERVAQEREKIQYQKPEIITGEEAMLREEAFTEEFRNPDPLEEKPEEPKQWISFKANMTVAQALELKKFFNDRNIEFGPITQ